MKKISMLLSGLLLVGATSFAQMSVDPEIGINISNISTKIGDNSSETHTAKVGLNAGLGLKFDITKNFYVKPGLYYNGFNTEIELLDWGNLANAKTTMSTHYLQLPVNLGLQGGLLGGNAGYVFAEVGPYIGYAVSGKFKSEGELLGISGNDVTDIDFGTGDNEVNPLDAGMKFAVGYETPIGIYLKGGYTLGLTNMRNIDNNKWNQRNWNVNLGYRIKF